MLEGIQALKNGNVNYAIQRFELAKKYNPNQVFVYQYLTNALLIKEDYAGAESTLKEGLILFNQNDSLRITLAKLYFQQQKWSEALREFKHLLEQRPGEAIYTKWTGRSYYNLGVLSSQQEKLDEAEQHFRHATKYLPNYLPAWKNLAFTMLKNSELGDKKSHNELFDEHILQEFPPQNHNNGQSQFRQFAELEAIFKKAYELDPQDLYIGLCLADVCLANQKMDKAFALYDELINKHPQERPVYERLIQIYESRFNYEKVREILEQYFKQFPQDHGLLRRIALTFEIEENWPEARKTYIRGFCFFENAQKFREWVGNTWMMEQAYEKAAEEYYKMIQHDSTNSQIYMLYGAALGKADQYDSAVEAYKQAMLMRPDNPDPAGAVAVLWEKQNKTHKARRYYLVADSLGSQDPYVHYRLFKLIKDRGLANEYLHLSAGEVLAGFFSLSSEFEAISEKGTEQALKDPQKLRQNKKKMSEMEGLMDNIFDSMEEIHSRLEYKRLIQTFLTRFEKSPYLWYRMGKLDLVNNLPGSAVKHFDRAIVLNPNYYRALIETAGVYTQLNKPDSAIVALKRAITLKPENKEPYLKLVQLCSEFGKLDELCNDWQNQAAFDHCPDMLRDHLVLALHKAGRHVEAKTMNQQLID